MSAAASARERVLAAVPALEGLLTDGAAGDEVRSDALAAGDDAQAWILWFLLRPDCLVVATPVAGLRPDAVDDAVVRCNAYNRGMRWSVLTVAPWDGDQAVRAQDEPEDPRLGVVARGEGVAADLVARRAAREQALERGDGGEHALAGVSGRGHRPRVEEPTAQPDAP